MAGETGRVGQGECSWGFSARGKVFREKNKGQSWGLAATQKGFLPAGSGVWKGESPGSEYLRGVVHMESPSWEGSLKVKKSSTACGQAFLPDGISYPRTWSE